MACCCSGASFTPALPLQAAASVPAARRESKGLRLRYLGQAALTLRGPFSGRVYNLDAGPTELTADPSDIDALLRTGLFETTGS
jgi:hypothetical protein